MRQVLHVARHGRWVMVGKIFDIADGHGGRTDVFYHAESGSQWHYTTNSPGGIDMIVAAYLRQQHVDTILHLDVGNDTLFACHLTDLAAFGIKERSDDRERLYLPATYWRVRNKRPHVPWVDDVKYLKPEEAPTP